MLIYILFTAVRCQPLIVCCLSVFVRLICTLFCCVLSTFNCILSLWFCHVYMYFMQMCAVNIWLYVVCVLLLCLYIYICFTAVWCTPSFVVCVLLVCLYIQPVASLKTFIKTNNLTDIWRKFNQDKQQFTWRLKDKTQTSRIDMIFIETDCCSLVETCKIKPVTMQSTDHQSVYINVIPAVSEKGRGYWKINNSILQEVEYNYWLIIWLINIFTIR